MHGFLSKLSKSGVHETMFGDVELIDAYDSDGEKVTLLKLDESLQSATYHGKWWHYPPFAYIRAFDHLFEADTARHGFGMGPVDNILLLGGGGFSYTKHVLASRSDITMDVVEIDPAIVRLARRHLYLDRLERLLLMEGRLDHLEIFIEDGVDHLKSSEASHDVIINDTFTGARAVLELLDETAIGLVKDHLRDGGMFLSNFVVDFTKEGPSELNRFVEKLASAFSYVHIVDACDEEFGGADNYIVIASDASYEFSDVIPF